MFIANIILCLLLNCHPLHLTVANIEYNENKAAFEISIKIFSDDFQTVIYNKFGKKIIVDNNDWSEDSQKLVNQYINENLKIFDCTKSGLKFVSKKINENAVVLNFETKCSDDLKELKIKNSVLTELYSDQKNLVIVKIDDDENGYQLVKGNDEVKIKL